MAWIQESFQGVKSIRHIPTANSRWFYLTVGHKRSRIFWTAAKKTPHGHKRKMIHRNPVQCSLRSFLVTRLEIRWCWLTCGTLLCASGNESKAWKDNHSHLRWSVLTVGVKVVIEVANVWLVYFRKCDTNLGIVTLTSVVVLFSAGLWLPSYSSITLQARSRLKFRYPQICPLETMSKPTPEPEIIDLTTSSPSPIPPEPLGHASRPVQDEPPSQETRRKRKRRLKKSTTSSTPTVTSSSSHRNSPERQPGPPTRDSKRQRPNQSENEELETTNRIRGNTNSGEEDNSDLFFVDLTPAVIPAARQIHTETSTEKTDSGRLLVPSHVTVLGSTPVQIISQPLSDSEDEDFIDYLDYDDNKVCSLVLRLRTVNWLT